jgi:hypothetical protein
MEPRISLDRALYHMLRIIYQHVLRLWQLLCHLFNSWSSNRRADINIHDCHEGDETTGHLLPHELLVVIYLRLCSARERLNMALCDKGLFSECWDPEHEMCLRLIDIETLTCGMITPDMANYLRERQIKLDDIDTTVVRPLTLYDMITQNRVDLVKTYKGDGFSSWRVTNLERALATSTVEMYDTFMDNLSCPLLRENIVYCTVIYWGNQDLLKHLCEIKGVEETDCLRLIKSWDYVLYTTFMHDLHDAATAAGNTGIPPHVRHRMFQEHVVNHFNRSITCRGVLMGQSLKRMLVDAWYSFERSAIVPQTI